MKVQMFNARVIGKNEISVYFWIVVSLNFILPYIYFTSKWRNTVSRMTFLLFSWVASLSPYSARPHRLLTSVEN